MATLKFNAENLEVLSTITTKLENCAEAIYIGNKEVVIAGMKSKKIIITKWDIESRRKLVSKMLIYGQEVRHLIFMPKMKAIVVLLKNSKRIIIMNRDLSIRCVLLCPFLPYSVDLDPARMLLFISGESGQVRTVSGLTFKLVTVSEVNIGYSWKVALKCVRVIPKLNYIACLSHYDRALVLWDWKKKQLVESLDVMYRYGAHYSLSFDSNTSLLALGCSENVSCFEVTEKGFENENVFSPFTQNYTTLANILIIPQIKCVMATSFSKTVWFWHIETGEVLNIVEGVTQSSSGLTLAPLGKQQKQQLVVIVSDSVNGDIVLIGTPKP